MVLAAVYLPELVEGVVTAGVAARRTCSSSQGSTSAAWSQPTTSRSSLAKPSLVDDFVGRCRTAGRRLDVGLHDPDAARDCNGQ